jgi:uncharacterized protein
MISQDLLRVILAQYTLPWSGIHGVPHWARVFENARRLAPRTGARLEVVELFSILHDARRLNEGGDPGHGRRAAEFSATLRGALIRLDPPDFDLLSTACAGHTDGLIDGNVTIQTCWDADRLDLGRVGIQPDRAHLGTPAAKDPTFIAWAVRRSRKGFVPAFVRLNWGVDLAAEDDPVV